MGAVLLVARRRRGRQPKYNCSVAENNLVNTLCACRTRSSSRGDILGVAVSTRYLGCGLRRHAGGTRGCNLEKTRVIYNSCSRVRGGTRSVYLVAVEVNLRRPSSSGRSKIVTAVVGCVE